MAKILALDIGDQWTGIAISDSMGILAKPYKTSASSDLEKELSNVIKENNISEIVIGYPKTMSGTESEQTKKTLVAKEKLEAAFPDMKFILWDERLSSKRAEEISFKNINFQNKSKTTYLKIKEEKHKSHSLAAAFILDCYLTYKQNSINFFQEEF